MGKYGRMLGEYLLKIAIKAVFTDENKAKVIAKVNLKMDVPFMNEEDEAKLLDIFWNVIRDALTEEVTEEEGQ